MVTTLYSNVYKSLETPRKQGTPSSVLRMTSGAMERLRKTQAVKKVAGSHGIRNFAAYK